MNVVTRLTERMEKSELTNVPDYQKIMQTVHSAGGKSSLVANSVAGWSNGLGSLKTSQTLHSPASISGSTDHPLFQRPLKTYSNYSQEVWDKPHAYPSSANVSDPGRIAWQGQPLYDASKYDPMRSSHSPPLKELTYIPQGYTRPVSKYVDANGVEHRIIKSPLPNRKSYTEGLVSKEDSKVVIGGGELRAASSQKHIPFNYSSPGFGYKTISGKTSESFEVSSPGIGLGKKGYLAQSMEHLGSGKDKLSAGDQWRAVGGGPGVKSSHENLRHWQQQHQEELLHQHLEAQALYESSPGNQSTVQEEPQARWEPVRRAADSIIREKNVVIDKLKNRILQLEEDFKESQTRLQEFLASKGEDVDLVKQKLLEIQHKNEVLKEQLREERSKKNSEIDSLEIKLGSTEHKIQKLQEVLRNKDLGLSELEQKLVEKVKESETWQQKYNKSCSSLQEMKKKLDGFQRYLDELPTVEESRLQAQTLFSLQEENAALKAKGDSQEKKLGQMRKAATAKDFRVKELEEQEKSLKQQIQELTLDRDRLRSGEGSELYKTQQSLKLVEADKDKLASDLEKAKKLLETTHQKLKQLEVKHQSELEAVMERVRIEEQTVVSLRSEVTSKEEQINKLNRSMKELGTQNQELLEKYLGAKEQARHMDSQSQDGSLALHRRFMLQLRACVSELQALVKVCSQCASGEAPDMSLLLGVKHPDSEEFQEGGALSGLTEPADHTKTLTQWLGQLGQLQKEVDRLRAHISNKYAEEMGDNIMCVTQ